MIRSLLQKKPEHLSQTQIRMDGRAYTVIIQQQVHHAPSAPRLLIPAYQPNETARHVLRVCVQTIQRYTEQPYELWVIDNNSPWEHAQWLLEWPDVNVICSRTDPLPRERRREFRFWRAQPYQTSWGSYANAVALELGRSMIDPQSEYLVTLHMDTMPCRNGWLRYLQSQLDERIAAAGVRMDRQRTPEGVLHVLGYIVRYNLFRTLNLDFWPQLPQYDVGDRVTVRLREAGYEVVACPNTLWEPHLIEAIPTASPLRNLHVDRAFDDKGTIIFLHLGRGVHKSSHQSTDRTSPAMWVRFAEEHLLG
jgi:hypothetical protein